jgi:hypothetical protein
VYYVAWDWLCASGAEDELRVELEARLELPERLDEGKANVGEGELMDGVHMFLLVSTALVHRI